MAFHADQPDQNDASLILKLYDLRRESVMRQARQFFIAWRPQSSEDVMAIAGDFSKPENAFFRQVVSYWEMAASFVNHGVLHPALFADNCGEGVLVYAMLHPHVGVVREAYAPNFLGQLERVVNEHDAVRAKFEMMKERLARM